jgi:hypothetical protein
MKLFTHRATAAIGALALLAGLALPALADVSIQLNGNPVTFSPGPVERAGRVFVPLRGVFERLGASVVYEGGVINATGNGRNISLKIGSNQATVNGATQTIDVAPFIIGASTYVPLRFVSQALGANVNYDSANRIVALTQSDVPAVAAAPTAAAASGVQLQSLNPARGASVTSQRPTIRADFSAPVDPNSLHVTLDGRDVTAETTLAPTGIVFAPPSPLQAMQHSVRITGTDGQGLPFHRSWNFTTGTQAAANFLNLNNLSEGTTVGTSFTVRGKTLPGAAVHIEAGSTIGAGPVSFGTGNYHGDVTADGAGNFSQSISVNGVSGGVIGLTVTSTDPSTQSTAQQQVHLRIG